MAKKKSQPPGKGPKKGPKRSPRPKAKPKARAKAEPLPEIPDRRAMEGVMRGFLGGLIGPREETPLSRAQDLVYKAFEARDPAKRAKLARQALEISPDCADAYTLLAEQARSRKEALELFEKAVAAGERALGPDVFRDEVGHFWGLIETRPYMRAREALASTLWTVGRRDEAVGHLQELLRLNPNDNQGVRYTLAGWLLAEGRDDELRQLLERYDEESANIAYTKALLAFRRHGDTPEARDLLRAARSANKHVPAYLLGERPMPLDQPGYYSPGEPNEAILYAGSALRGWRETPGAIAWLKEQVTPAKKRKPKGPKAEGPTGPGKERLRRLPQSFDVWQADFRPMPNWVEVGGRPVRPWVVLVTSRSNDLVLAHAIAEQPPSADLLWDQLADAARKPAAGPPHRPTEVQVLPGEHWDALRPHLDDVGINLVTAGELDQLDFVFGDMARHLTGDAPPGLLEMPGITPERVAGFYAAAAGFYRRAPWRKLGYETAIRVATDRFESGPWYAVVMGQSGMTFGLALYDDLGTLKKLWEGSMSEEENARETVALTVTYGDETEVPVSDLDAGRKLGWEVAGPDAYPSVFRKERGMSMRPPLAWELELMEGCLRAVPAFVARHPPDDTSSHRLTVPAGPGDLTLTMAWVED
jgi:tetratricopeptide (TPR) repeat protein